MEESSGMTISPLIATVLLIAFSFALGAVVLSWGESFVEERAGFVNDASEVSSGCSGVKYAVLEVDGRPYACASGNGIAFILDNIGRDIVELEAKLIARDDIRIIDNVLAQPIKTGDTERVVVPYTGEPLLQVRITPSIHDGSLVSCPAAAKTINGDLPPC